MPPGLRCERQRGSEMTKFRRATKAPIFAMLCILLSTMSYVRTAVKSRDGRVGHGRCDVCRRLRRKPDNPMCRYRAMKPSIPPVRIVANLQVVGRIAEGDNWRAKRNPFGESPVPGKKISGFLASQPDLRAGRQRNESVRQHDLHRRPMIMLPTSPSSCVVPAQSFQRLRRRSRAA